MLHCIALNCIALLRIVLHYIGNLKRKSWKTCCRVLPEREPRPAPTAPLQFLAQRPQLAGADGHHHPHHHRHRHRHHHHDQDDLAGHQEKWFNPVWPV